MSEKTPSRFLQYIASPNIVFWTFPWLMVIIVLGTVSQKYIGLYNSSAYFFNSWILWLGPIPTPGYLTLIGIIFVSVLVKFLFFSQWSWQKSGTIISHLGVLTLLLGGLIASFTTKEGFMIIPEGQTSSHFSYYYDRALKIGNQAYDFQSLKAGDRLEQDGLVVTILMKCDNCGAQAPTGTYKNLQDLAQNMELTNIREEKQKEANLSGLILLVENTHTPSENGTYILMLDIPRVPTLRVADQKEVKITLERQRYDLPFAVELTKFEKIDYDGTSKAKNYKSELTFREGLVTWPVTIQMNEPYRYQGYSFYQSSFDIQDGQALTVLTIVKNKGRLFPYLSSALFLLGLLIHVMITLRSKGDRS